MVIAALMIDLRALFSNALCLFLGAALAIDAAPASAQDREVPYWASMRFDEVNMRVGPSQEYKIDWVYKRKGLPVKVVRLREGWRLVQDPDGIQGWVAQSQLTPERTALVIGEGLIDLRDEPNPSSALKWRAEPGVVGTLGECRANFCEIDVGGRSGWVLSERLWGAGEP
ncbi:MAG: SH3 domain-containing protein [Erythrobacter sp.]|nr:SH3 domain-containing protein [Erythrobacter sp.]